MKENFQYVCSVFGAGIGYLVGGFDGFLYALIFFMIVDYITGVLVGIVNKNLSSEIGFKGIIKKVTIMFMVMVANIIDNNLLQEGSVVRTAVIFFYLSNEGISLVENANNLGVPIPKKLVSVLKSFEDTEKK